MKLNEMIVLADNDGTIRDTNNVKDKCLDVFLFSRIWTIFVRVITYRIASTNARQTYG